MPPSQPHIRILHPGDQPALEVFLQQCLETSLFLLSNMRQAGLVNTGRRFEGTYAAAFEGEAIAGVVALFWNGSLIYQAPNYLPALQEAVRIATTCRSRRCLARPIKWQPGWTCSVHRCGCTWTILRCYSASAWPIWPRPAASNWRGARPGAHRCRHPCPGAVARRLAD